MSTAGEFISKTYNDDEGVTPQMIDERLAKHIGTQEGRQKLVKYLRNRNIFADKPDEELISWVGNNIRPQGVSADEALESKRSKETKEAIEGYKNAIRETARVSSTGRPAQQKEAVAEERELLGPEDIQRVDVPMAERFSDIEDEQKRTEGSEIVDVGGTVQLQVPGVGAVSQLKHGATINPLKVSGLNPLTMAKYALTGEADPLQVIPATIARSIYDPRTGKIGTAEVTGLPEYSEDVGAAIGKRGGSGTQQYITDVARAGSVAAGAGSYALGLFDEAQEIALNLIIGGAKDMTSAERALEAQKSPLKATFREMAEANKAEAKREYGSGEELIGQILEFGQPTNPELAEAAGQAVGRTTGEAAQLISPTMLGIGGAKVASKYVIPAFQAASRATWGKLADTALGKFLVSNPHALALKPNTQATVKGIQTAYRTAGTVEARQMHEAINKDLDDLFSGMPGVDREKVLAEADAAWTHPVLRQQASKEAQAVIDRMQPYHRKVAVDFGGIPEERYNPYHPLYGQNIRRPNLKERTYQERELETMEEPHGEDVFVRHRIGEDIKPIQGEAPPPLPPLQMPAPGKEISTVPERALPQAKPISVLPESQLESLPPGLSSEIPTVYDKPAAKQLPEAALGPLPKSGPEEIEFMAEDIPGIRSMPKELVEKWGPRVSGEPSRRTKEAIAGNVANMLKERGMLASDIERERKAVSSGDLVGGVVASAFRAAKGNGPARHALAGEILKRNAKPIMDEYANKGILEPFDAYMQRNGVDPTLARQVMVDVYGSQRTGKGAGKAMDVATENALLKDGNVVLMPRSDFDDLIKENTPLVHSKDGQPLAMAMPEGFIGSQPVVVPRHMAMAFSDIVDPKASAEMVEKLATDLDKFFALTQMNMAITRGQPGFTTRLLIGDMGRALMSEGSSMLSPKLRSLTVKVSNAPYGGGEMIKDIGMTTGSLREMLEQEMGLGGSAYAYAKKLGGEARGAELLERVGGPKLRGLSETIAKATSAPGRAHGAASEAVFRHSMYPGLNNVYDAPDAIRMALAIQKMRKGMLPSKAMYDAKVEMIDFADKGTLEKLGRVVDPFISYHLKALEGAIMLSIKHPQRFARLHQVAGAIENYDAATHGDRAVNAKLKTFGQLLGGMPATHDPYSAGARLTRVEAPQQEAADLLESMMVSAGLTSGPQGVGAKLGPVFGGMYETATSRSPSTGRPLYGSEDYREEWARGLGPLGYLKPVQAAQAYKEQFRSDPTSEFYDPEMWGTPTPKFLGDNPALGFLQSIGGSWPATMVAPTPPWMSSLGRLAIGAGAPAHSRSEEQRAQQLSRLMPSLITGMRSSTVQPTEVAIRRLREAQRQRKIPTPIVDILAKEAKGR